MSSAQLVEGSKVLTIARSAGPLLISADIHGHFADFARLREIFLASLARGEDPTWVGVGDWVHGPAGDTSHITDRDGQPLYGYPDESVAILEALFVLMDAHPDRVFSLLGNHEHAHIGGPRTSKFHRDEAAHLEAQLSPTQIENLHARLHRLPLLILVPSCGVVITHGAMSGPLSCAKELETIRYAGANTPNGEALLRATMTHYGYTDGGDERLLNALSEPGRPSYQLLVHGHDRDEEGFAKTGTRAALLCSSFGARRERKAYLWLDLGQRYHGPEDLRDGLELRRLY
jgi:hypothetical protein